ncbi:MFS transporter [Gilvimarinus sp. SDUM040013]|uniref:MFS transporter n=1 Tax=Gilvimarinus gilvus TaxID=3058038 RepID=A0ABU4S3T1_9GAMM|nr:MFS transporter [Gilvimarinus sp. SDUM040013]MDO3384450.1 MFS transporter [Gilvimarinus sp. SDUM040013]MDX6851081.1 MFS transporter [Gilvimarinus sp. SDUM040013]
MTKSANARPELSFWQIWNMCFGFIGIQFGFALQNANVSRIFQTLGASIDELPILWVAAPLTGLLVQPIIGYFSDKTWNRLGRRRPYFLIGALLTTASLLFMPHSPTLWIAAGMLWIMDASINISMEPFRAFVGDMLPQKQRTLGFAMQGFFIGLASVVASSLPWLMTNVWDISNTAAPGTVPDSVIWAFSLGGIVLLLAVGWTILTTREYSPEQLAKFNAAEGQVETKATATLKPAGFYHQSGWVWLLLGALGAATITGFALQPELYILAGCCAGFAVLQLIAAALQKQGRTEHGVYQITHDLFHMPRTMMQLAVVQFFSWFALFAMWIYLTPAVANYHFGATDTSGDLFNKGADWAGVLQGSYNGYAMLAAFIIPVMARKLGRKLTHSLNLLCGALGFASFLLVRDPTWLLVSMVGVGIAWASILSMPYAMLSCALPGQKMGVYMGIFNFFIVIPQILAASILGLVVRTVFAGNSIYALVLGGACFLIAAGITLKVDDAGE